MSKSRRDSQVDGMSAAVKLLDTASDELNALFNEACALLDRDFHGIYAEVPGGSFSLAFGAGASDGRWGIILIRSLSKAVPVTSATREERINCAGLLPVLYVELCRARDKLYAQVVEAKRVVSDFIEERK